MYKEIIDFIINVGFPIACCIFMGIYIRNLHAEHRKDINDITIRHTEEVNGLRSTIENNTLAINTLIERCFYNENK